MSRMTTHGSRYCLLAVVLASLAAGCQGMPASPGDSAVRQTSAVEPAADGAAGHEASAIPVADDANRDDALDDESEKKSGFDLEDLDPKNVYNNLKVMAGLGPDEKLARQYYDEGHALYREKRYAEAAAKFKSAAGRWPDSTLEEDAMFFQGESLFFADNYPKSHDAFGNLLKKYDNSRYLDRVVVREFSIGRYWEQLQDAEPHWPVTPNLLDRDRPLFDTFGNAVKAYETVTLNDPTGPLSDEALMALGNAYFVRERYADAVFYYDRIRKDYPQSKHQVQAHLLAMKSNEMIYQGPLYDGQPLSDAGKIADQTLTQFGPQLGDERDNVVKTRSKIDAQLAERDWGMAKFYEGKRLYGAARYYYRQMIKDYPGTEIARASEKRIEEIKDYPDKPPNPFAPLTNLLPSEK